MMFEVAPLVWPWPLESLEMPQSRQRLAADLATIVPPTRALQCCMVPRMHHHEPEVEWLGQSEDLTSEHGEPLLHPPALAS